MNLFEIGLARVLLIKDKHSEEVRSIWVNKSAELSTLKLIGIEF